MSVLSRKTIGVRSPFNFIRLALRLRAPLSMIVMAFGILGLASNFFRLTPLLQPLDGRATTHPITALCLVGLGLSLWQTRRFGQGQLWRFGLLSGIMVLSSARIMDAILGQISGTNPHAVFGPVMGFNGRFSIEAAIILGAFAAAALARKGAGRWGGVFLAIGLAMVYSATLEVSYGQTLFNGDLGPLTYMGMLAAAGAMVSIHLHRPYIRVAFLLGDIGSQTRMMIVAILTIPWVCGFMLFGLSPSTAALGAPIAGMISVMTSSMMILLLTTSARHESSVVMRRNAERELAMRSRVDAGTGALNRFGITELVEGAWVDFKAAGSAYGVILIDLEYFRTLDADFGRNDGEGVLARVASTLMPQLRASDALGRWGANEFLIILKIKDISNLFVVSTRLRSAIASRTSPFGNALQEGIRPSNMPLGISEMRVEDASPTDAISRADHNLHLAKIDSASAPNAISMDAAQLFMEVDDEALAFAADAAADAEAAKAKDLAQALEEAQMVLDDEDAPTTQSKGHAA